MSPRALGDGEVIDIGVDIDPRDQQIETLKAENRRLQRAVADAELSASRAQEDTNRALSALRYQLGPLFRALQMVFGELDAAGVTDGATSATSTPSSRGADHRWDAWKERLGSNCAKVIDALLLGGEMTITAITVSAKIGKNTAYQATSKMGQAGILVRNGSKFSLKQL